MLKLLVLFIAVSASCAEKVTPFAVGGVDTVWGAFPSSVVFDSPLQYCGGSIIDRSHILTAATCVLHKQYEIIHPRWFDVVAGDVFFSPPSAGRVHRNVSNIFVHPDYNPFNGQHNLAIIRVSPPFPHPHNTIEPARLQTRIVHHGASCLLAAFGGQTPTTTFVRARQVQITQPIISNNDCALVNTPHANRITNDMMCATTTTSNAPCVGNLGSGLYCDGVLTGVLTSGVACGAANTPAVYHQTRVYRDWIQQQLIRTDHVIPGSSPFDSDGFPANF